MNVIIRVNYLKKFFIKRVYALSMEISNMELHVKLSKNGNNNIIIPTTTSKVVNTAIFGFFGTKRHKQWHCNQCNSDF